MITNEPSQQVTPLSTEQAGFPEQIVPDGLNAATPAGFVHAVVGSNQWLRLYGPSFLLLAVVPVIIALPYMIYTWSTHGPPAPGSLKQSCRTRRSSSLDSGPFVANALVTLGLIWLFATEGRRKPFWEILSSSGPTISRPFATLSLFPVRHGAARIGGELRQFWAAARLNWMLMVESSMARALHRRARRCDHCSAGRGTDLSRRTLFIRSNVLPEGNRGRRSCPLLFAGVHVFQYSHNYRRHSRDHDPQPHAHVFRALTGSVIPPFIFTSFSTVYSRSYHSHSIPRQEFFQ